MVAKRILFVCMALVAAFSATAVGCNSSGEGCILEAENAVIEPEYDDGSAEVMRANSRSENVTSGGKYAGKLGEGDTVTWFFTAEQRTQCRIVLSIANADASSASFVADNTVFELYLNDRLITLPDIVIYEGSTYCDDWQIFDIGSLTVDAGINKLVYRAMSDQFSLNVDYVALSAGRTEIAEHSHFWKNSSVAATCLENGYSVKTCEDCGYSYVSDLITATGHQNGNYHYDDALNKMVAVCEKCGDTLTANTPDSRYFGEVFYSEDDFVTRPDELVFEAEDAYVCTDGGLNNGVTYLKEDDGNCNQPSGGKLVENISNLGNYIRFVVEAERPCVADLVFRMSNTLYSAEGIAELSPMSDYVYCTVDGVEVDFTFVSFPGFAEHSYFEWRYVVIKNVDLAETSLIEIGPKDNDRHSITMPNTDVLKIYTDGVKLRAIKNYGIDDVVCGEYDGRYANALDFADGDELTLYAGSAAEQADIVVKLSSPAVANAASVAELAFNGSLVKLEGISLREGENTLVLRGVSLALLTNTLNCVSDSVELISAMVYTDEKIERAYTASILPQYDYLKNKGQEGATVPALIFEAEAADLGDSQSSREGVELIETDIYENTSQPASGNSAVGNFGAVGNAIEWRFDSSESVQADVTLMLASAYFDSSVDGNVMTDDLDKRIILRVNGVAVRLDEIVLDVDSVANYYDWKAVTVCGVDLKEGLNTVRIEVLAYGAPNMDVMYVYADGATFTAQSN